MGLTPVQSAGLFEKMVPFVLDLSGFSLVENFKLLFLENSSYFETIACSPGLLATRRKMSSATRATLKDLEHILVETSIAEEFVLFRGSIDFFGP